MKHVLQCRFLQSTISVKYLYLNLAAFVCLCVCCVCVCPCACLKSEAGLDVNLITVERSKLCRTSDVSLSLSLFSSSLQPCCCAHISAHKKWWGSYLSCLWARRILWWRVYERWCTPLTLACHVSLSLSVPYQKCCDGTIVQWCIG